MTTTPVAAPTELLRTAQSGCWKIRSGSLGKYLASVKDPLANVEITREQLESFELSPDFIKIPAPLWSRWLRLCLELAQSDTGTLEVSCRLLRHQDDPSQWRIIVPLQDVCSASVRVDTFDDSVDIETGERIASYPPDGWIPMGSSHSHNTMTLDRFSSTDDSAELGDPGVHILISHCNEKNDIYTWTQTDSVVAGRRRFYLPKRSLTEDVTALEPYHQDARAQVMHLRPRALFSPLSQSRPRSTNWGKDFDSRFEDPFYWNDSPSPAASAKASGNNRSAGEELLSLFRSDGEQWNKQLNEMFAEIDDTVYTLIACGDEPLAVAVLDFLHSIAEGNIPPSLEANADSRCAPDWEA
jgi:hypothetical protein